MRGTAEKHTRIYAHKEPAWDWFWRVYGRKLLGRVIAILGAVEAIGVLGLSLVQAEGALLTLFFLLALLPVILAAVFGLVLAGGFYVSWSERRGKWPHRREKATNEGDSTESEPPS